MLSVDTNSLLIVTRNHNLEGLNTGCKMSGSQFLMFAIILCISLANANRPARCWAVSTSPTCGRRALVPPSWSLFLTV